MLSVSVCLRLLSFLGVSRLAVSQSCLPSTLKIPSNFSNASPLLIFTSSLEDLPLPLISQNAGVSVLAAPQNVPTPQATRRTLRAGVQIAVRPLFAPYFYAATGRPALFCLVESNSPSIHLSHHATAISLNLTQDRDNRDHGTRILYDKDASDYLNGLSHGRVSPTETAETLESLLDADTLRCAFEFWSCDFVARDEPLYNICMRIRSIHLSKTGADIYRFSIRSDSEILQRGKGTVGVLGMDEARLPGNDFIEMHRARVEAGYWHLRNFGGTSAAPIREILWVLFGAAYLEIVSGVYIPVISDEEQSDGDFAAWLIRMTRFVVGIAFLAWGSKEVVHGINGMLGEKESVLMRLVGRARNLSKVS